MSSERLPQMLRRATRAEAARGTISRDNWISCPECGKCDPLGEGDGPTLAVAEGWAHTAQRGWVCPDHEKGEG